MRAASIPEFADKIEKVLRTDRWALLVVSGEMGEGKSCFTDQITHEVAKRTKTKFNRETHMIYKRKDLKKAIDGDVKNNNEGQLPELSVLHCDELISMFFKRNWFDVDQIDGIELLNKCRDRHLCVAGNIPDFWDLDSAIYSAITFWVHIDARGRAWLFQKSKNPFTKDKWHRKENEKVFQKRGHPYLCKGFVTEIQFPDWTPEEKERYYDVRNRKRKDTEGQRSRTEKYGDIKLQRDELIRFVLTLRDHENNPVVNQKAIAQLTRLDPTMISYIHNNKR